MDSLVILHRESWSSDGDKQLLTMPTSVRLPKDVERRPAVSLRLKKPPPELEWEAGENSSGILPQVPLFDLTFYDRIVTHF
jgi:hypothetical protein